MKRKPESRAITRTGRWKPIFIAHLAKFGVVTYAAEAAGVDRRTAHHNKNSDKTFAAAWDDALAQAADILELEARRRAHDGVDEPVFGRVGKDKDGEVGRVRKYSDSLMQFLLRGSKPDKYRENHKVTINGQLNHRTAAEGEIAADSILAELQKSLGIAAENTEGSDRTGAGVSD